MNFWYEVYSCCVVYLVPVNPGTCHVHTVLVLALNIDHVTSGSFTNALLSSTPGRCYHSPKLFGIDRRCYLLEW